jgi:hypothetical protein
MSKYTPTTEQVENTWAGNWVFEATPAMSGKEARAQFARWLATVKADAFDEGADAALENQETYFHREGEAGWDGFGVSHAIGIDRATKSTPNPHRGADDE